MHPPREFCHFGIAMSIPSAVLGTVYVLQNNRPASDHPNLTYVALKDGVATELCHRDYYDVWYATEATAAGHLRYLPWKYWTRHDVAATDAIIVVRFLLNELREQRFTLGAYCPPDPWDL